MASPTVRLIVRLIARVRRLAARAGAPPPGAVDAVIAAVCGAYVTVHAAVDGRLAWWVALLATAASVPLLWRRRRPSLVACAVGAGTVAMHLSDVLTDLPAAQLVATYTFAALCPPVRRLVLGAVTAVVLAAAVLLGSAQTLGPGGTGAKLLVAAAPFVVAYAMGTSARARRDRIAMLEERARRLAEEQDAAAARERERIAREMHDILAHSMSMVAVQAEAGPVAVRSDPARAEEMFDAISDTAREALAQLRRTLGVLRADEPSRRPQPGLEALPALIAGVRRAGLDVSLEEDGTARRVPADLSVTAYRVVQESLTNTVKHAGARSARVRLRWGGGALRLEVRDDGRGPNGAAGPRGEDAAGTGGHGLIGMRERVAAVGGELSYGPGPDGRGFRVAAVLPLE
ncbi:two-component sensor histidine kinase [Actinomadura rubrobrunea]|uniref:histidine kinase n=1 Tax=Actinomadura rubrobrunea TaxID=115335 RepID=A0A9W6PRQ7_9ACTN|nr:sensor histidine kinase [Actinomadura rubrobrunea]GLW63280.1 two-component sensor histidine kinase [Actinomadura rubrobrunea]